MSRRNGRDGEELRVKTPAEVRAILAELRARLENIYGDRLRGLYLYGSYARGDARVGSDLDVLVVLDQVHSYWEEIKRTSYVRAELSLAHDLTISLTYIGADDWHGGQTPFLRGVRHEARAA